MSEPFLGQIMLVGFNFPPRNWTFCEGQLLPIAQNSALFSLLGTTYGGDGRSTFGLPDLRGRVPRGVGSGPGLSTTTWGQKGGRNTHTMTITNMPSHNHTGVNNAYSGPGNQTEPGGHVPAQSADDAYSSQSGDSNLAGTPVNTGGGQAFNIDNPYIGMYYAIALQGLYPSRS